MQSRALIRLSGFAAVLGGIAYSLLGLSMMARIFVGGVAMSAAGILWQLGALFEVLAMLGFFACQFRPVGRLGLAGFVLMVSGVIIDLFPPLGPVMLWIGLMLFALANRRVGLLPAWGFWLWLIGLSFLLVFSFLGWELLQALPVLLIAASMIWLGAALRRRFTSEG